MESGATFVMWILHVGTVMREKLIDECRERREREREREREKTHLRQFPKSMSE